MGNSGDKVTIPGTRGHRAEPCACTEPFPDSGSGSQEFPWEAEAGIWKRGDVCSLDCSQEGTLQPEVKQNRLKA